MRPEPAGVQMMKSRARPILTGLALAGAITMAALPAAAQSIRQDDRIARPPANRPIGTPRVTGIVTAPVDPQQVRNAILAIARAWNGQALSAYIDRNRFYDKRRLLDTIARQVPRNAKLKILSVSGITTTGQKTETRPGKGVWRVSTVNATVFLQVEFLQPQTGFRRLQGRNIWTLQVEQRLR